MANGKKFKVKRYPKNPVEESPRDVRDTSATKEGDIGKRVKEFEARIPSTPISNPTKKKESLHKALPVDIGEAPLESEGGEKVAEVKRSHPGIEIISPEPISTGTQSLSGTLPVEKVAQAIPKIAQYTVKPFTKWFGGAVAESLKAKTLETLALVIVATILGAFGFIFAAIGVVFFIAFLYLPGEAEILARAREQGRNLPVNQLVEILDEIELTKAKIRESKSSEKKELFQDLGNLYKKKEQLLETAKRQSGLSHEEFLELVKLGKEREE